MIGLLVVGALLRDAFGAVSSGPGALDPGLAVATGGRYALSMSNGFTEHFIAMMDLDGEKVVQRVPIRQGWLGIALSAGEKTVGALAGAYDRILVCDFAGGVPKPRSEMGQHG
jgi:hypothetical protein